MGSLEVQNSDITFPGPDVSIDNVPLLTLVLASQSPRRRELLNAAGMNHVVRVAGVDETPLPGETAVEYVTRVARDKAMAVACAEGEVVLAADTTVVCDGAIFGKPADKSDARRMLRALSGRSHEVITGICLRTGVTLISGHEITRVWLSAISERDIDEYLLTDEPMDKAGAYAVQGIASRYVERLEGSYSNVVGLPVALVCKELERLRNSLS